MEINIKPLLDISALRDFHCGIPPMDKFILDGLEISIRNHYCKAYLVRNDKDDSVVAMFALSFDSLDLDNDDKDDMMSGISTANIPEVSFDYKDIFLNKLHYPALEIAYLAVREDCHRKGIGSAIVDAIANKVQEQDLAGCQFITVEALCDGDYNAIGFYAKCNFSPCEEPIPVKKTLRMFRTLFPKYLE